MRSLAVLVASMAATGGAWPDSASSAARASGSEASLCFQNEEVIASCRLRQKMVSVCGRSGSATYRFGRTGRIELSANGMYHAHQMFSGGGESQIVVHKGDYQYVLYDSTIRTGFGRDGHNYPVFASGLMVLRNGRHLADMACAPGTEAIIDTNSAPRFMPAGAYVWHRGMGSSQLPRIRPQ